MQKKVTKAIFPVAGLGTRFLPATKAIPKEIMTLVDKPLIQYAIDEARAAGIKEFIFVTSRGKGALEDYFDHSPQLEAELRKKGKKELLATLKSTNMDSGAIAYIRQQDVISWLTPSDPGSATLRSHFNRKTLRDWKNVHPKHRSFCVVSHPLERAHRVFWNFVLDKENDEFVNVRQKLMNRYMVPLVNRDNDLKSFQYKEAFLRFLKFLQSNLAGQTTVQVHPLWASQANIVAGFANFALPDFIIRSHESSEMLPQLQQHPLGIHTPFSISSDTREARLLSEIYDEELEDVCRKAYQKDYTVFGYGPLFAP